MTLREEANYIIHEAIQAVLPDEAVRQALKAKEFDEGKIYMVAVGKAAWQMAQSASKCLGERIARGVCISKYGHIMKQDTLYLIQIPLELQGQQLI